MKKYIIFSYLETHTNKVAMFWSNTEGWINSITLATKFSEHEKSIYHLPIPDGTWIRYS
jgi:hypothetical protein